MKTTCLYLHSFKIKINLMNNKTFRPRLHSLYKIYFLPDTLFVSYVPTFNYIYLTSNKKQEDLRIQDPDVQEVNLYFFFY